MSHHVVLTSLLMGAALAEFGLTGLSGPAEPPARTRIVATVQSPDASAPGLQLRPVDARESVLIPQSVELPAVVGEGPPVVGGSSHDDGSLAGPLSTLPRPPANGGPPAGMRAPRPEMAGDIDRGVRDLDSSMRKIPGYTAKMIGQVEEHGIAALAYEDPEMKRTGQAIGEEVGSGIRHLMNALGKDMVSGARGSGAGRR